MTSVVLDTSSVIAFLRKEPGGERVAPMLRGARLSIVNYCEIIGKGNDILTLIPQRYMPPINTASSPF